MNENKYIQPTIYGLNNTPLKIYIDLVSAYLSHVGKPYSNFSPSFKNFSKENNFFGIYHCFEGEGIIRTKQKDFHLKKDECLFVFYYDMHSIESLTENWRYTSIFFYAEKVTLPCYKIYSCPPFSHERKNILSVIKLLQAENPWSSAKANAIFQMLLCDILSHTSAQDNPSPYADILQSLSDYIHQNLNEPLTVDTLTKFCSFSKTHLNNIFKQYFKMSPKAYITKAKMEKAEKLLTNTNLPIASISDDLAFYSPSHFISCFKKYYKVTPYEYRKNN